MSQHKALYNSTGWQRRRKAQLSAHPLCRMHLELGQPVAATVADHIVPHRGNVELFYGGALQSLCASCHSAHKQRQERSGTLRGSGVTGEPLDAMHHWRA